MDCIKMTKGNIERIAAPESKFTDIADQDYRYLRIRITSQNLRTWYLVRKVTGRVHFIKLGTYPETTPTQARRAAEAACAKLLSGEKPGQQKPDKMTLEELFNLYLSEVSAPAEAPKKRTWWQDESNFKNHLQSIAKRRLTDIDRAIVVKIHNGLADSSGLYAANRVLALLKTVFNYAIFKLEMEITNPCRSVKMHPEESRDRFMSGSELGQFFSALHDEQTLPHWRDFFMLTLLTGARRSNVQAMQWVHIDLESAIWRIPGKESKNKNKLRIVLSPPALEILHRRREITEGDFVFPARGKSGHIEEPKTAWGEILARAGLKDLRIHDLRRTMGSWQLATGASKEVIGKSLGHLNSKTTEVYARMNLDPVRSAVNAATNAMLANMGQSN